MKERPILFSTPMVLAILEGRKTMTRRVIKAPQIKLWEGRPNEWRAGLCFHGMVRFNNGPSKQPSCCDFAVSCPHGEPGDLLYVRETFCAFPDGNVFYRADNKEQDPVKGWKPSIHMPRKYSRIKLEITDIRVERLNDISQKDAMKEGCPVCVGLTICGGSSGCKQCPSDNPVRWFSELWESLNGAGSWNANPWVFVEEFKVIKE